MNTSWKENAAQWYQISISIEMLKYVRKAPCDYSEKRSDITENPFE